jgi:hypothetical protein
MVSLLGIEAVKNDSLITNLIAYPEKDGQISGGATSPLVGDGRL